MDGFWKEFHPILYYSGWIIEGGPNWTSFPDGVTINVATDKRNDPAFVCGWQLSQLLQALHVENISFHVNQTTPSLIQCPKCTEVVLGDIAVH